MQRKRLKTEWLTHANLKTGTLQTREGVALWASHAHTCLLTLPFLGLQPAAAASSWVPCSALTPRPSSHYKRQQPTISLAWASLRLAPTATGGVAPILASCTATDLLLLVDSEMGWVLLCTAVCGSEWNDRNICIIFFAHSPFKSKRKERYLHSFLSLSIWEALF